MRTKPKNNPRPVGKTAVANHVGSGDLLGDLSVELQLAKNLADAGSAQTVEWLKAAGPLCPYCQGRENVDQAAMRILAAEVRRLRQVLHNANVCFFADHEGDGKCAVAMLDIINTGLRPPNAALEPSRASDDQKTK